MIRARLIRQPSTDEGTFGLFTIPQRALSWISLELPWRSNSPRKSCIHPAPGEPPVLYLCRLGPSGKWSPRNDAHLFELINVEGRTEIKIHAGTWAGDVDLGWHTDLRGCIAPGRRVGALTHPDVGREQACILQSRLALTELMAELGVDDFELEIEWASG